MKKFASDCGAKNPENLTSTKLKKHLATMSQIIKLKDNEPEQLANHLGHDVAVHREYYRLPQESLSLAKVSKLLFAMQAGKLHGYRGMSLNEITVSSLEEADLDEEFLSDGSAALASSSERDQLVKKKPKERK
ncbi:hypothetical protein HOLleu_42721 [Holothuria leucospilota]|uniref:Uncharacterized protein n=1 Tax=Holothuria leucospilota TaxID=206669 RepID=A0A9Q0YAC2_HOLLE|nr:hypothetical protein HOLleu_42721 [Holothuria leucospilota]